MSLHCLISPKSHTLSADHQDSFETKHSLGDFVFLGPWVRHPILLPPACTPPMILANDRFDLPGKEPEEKIRVCWCVWALSKQFHSTNKDLRYDAIGARVGHTLACWQVKLKPLIKQVGVDTDLDFILVESSYMFLSMGHDITWWKHALKKGQIDFEEWPDKTLFCFKTGRIARSTSRVSPGCNARHWAGRTCCKTRVFGRQGSANTEYKDKDKQKTNTKSLSKMKFSPVICVTALGSGGAIGQSLGRRMCSSSEGLKGKVLEGYIYPCSMPTTFGQVESFLFMLLNHSNNP